jgi:peptidoglycan hydrolase CwlO-like protein
MKTEFITGLISTVAGASLIGGGGMVLKAASDNAQQDTKIETIQHRQESLDATLEQLHASVQSLDKNVAVLNERVTRETHEPRN